MSRSLASISPHLRSRTARSDLLEALRVQITCCDVARLHAGTPTRTCRFCPPSPEPALNPNRLLRCDWLAPTHRFPLVPTGPGQKWTFVHFPLSPVHPSDLEKCPVLSCPCGARPGASLETLYPSAISKPARSTCSCTLSRQCPMALVNRLAPRGSAKRVWR